MITENENIISLYDYYKGLLTSKQQESFEMYYFNDYSLGEIAAYLNISRNAVFDQIKKASKALLEFENILHLREKESERNKIIEEYEGIYHISLDKLKNI